MDNKDKDLSRREFFKCCAKVALPIIGGILLSKTEAVAKALDSADCNNNCSNSCRTTCRTSCMHSCSGACFNSCSNSCAGTCTGKCSHTCSESCQNTSKSEPEKSDTICHESKGKKKNKKK